MKIYLHELKKQFLIAIIYTSICSIFLIVFLSFYHSFMNRQTLITNLLSQFSPQALDFFNIEPNTLFTTLGFYSLLFPIISFIEAIFAIHLGLYISCDDKLHCYREFLFTKPITRKKILTFKFMTSLTYLILNTLWIQLLSYVVLIIVRCDTYSFLTLFQINTSLFLLMLVFISIAMFLGGFIHKDHYIYYATLTSIFFEILNLIEHSLNLNLLKYINPFSYFNVMDIINTNHYQTRFITITIFLVFFSLSFAYGIYNSDDVVEVKK